MHPPLHPHALDNGRRYVLDSSAFSSILHAYWKPMVLPSKTACSLGQCRRRTVFTLCFLGYFLNVHLSLLETTRGILLVADHCPLTRSMWTFRPTQMTLLMSGGVPLRFQSQ
ncbi:hypothetical protein OG21DRAFT_1326067 [Imleria badia]|nr:hypothetical protein OG21DRAFT_1326067 [Imleria badia]